MDKSFRITYRVPTNYQDRVRQTMTDRKIGDAEFMLEALDAYFNPKVKEVIKEVDKLVYRDVEVIKNVDVEKIVYNEQEITELTINLDRKVYEFFDAKKLSSMSMQDYANNFMWEKLENTRNWYEQNSKPKNQQSYDGNPQNKFKQDEVGQFAQTAQSSVEVCDEYRKRRIDCSTEDDWKPIADEIKIDTRLSQIQKDKLLTGR